MSSFVVRHLPEDIGAVTSIYKEVRKTPSSYTSRKHEAEMASEGAFIYVIEREKAGRKNVYKLAYCYKCSEIFKKAGGSKWLGQFDFKNTVKYGNDSELRLFDPPIVITDPGFISWYKTKTLGMCELPSNQERVLLDMLV